MSEAAAPASTAELVGPARLARPGALHERLPKDASDDTGPVRGGGPPVGHRGEPPVGYGGPGPLTAARQLSVPDGSIGAVNAPKVVEVIGPAAARRAALAAQGFADAGRRPRSAGGTWPGCSRGSGCSSSTR